MYKLLLPIIFYLPFIINPQGISFTVDNPNLKMIISEIESQVDLKFAYENDINLTSELTGRYSFEKEEIDKILEEISNRTTYTFNVLGSNIVVDPPKEKAKSLINIGSKFQQVTVEGIVTNPDGNPLPSVTVQEKGTNNGVLTDFDGKYSIEVSSAEAVLVFTYVGMISSERVVGKNTTMNVEMEPDLQGLDEVVVIGYGTQRKSDLTGAVGSVRTEELQERPAASLNEALSGKISGVQVNTNSGRPGGRTNVRIRGFSSINSSNNPLYVVDGVQLPQENMDQMSSAIDYLNPNDIESVEILKDASSTAIYGSKGANGVIIVTTKRGRGEGRITYDGTFSTVTVGPNFPEVLNSNQYLATEDLAWANMAKFDPEGWDAGRWEYLNPELRRTDPRIFDSNGNPLYDTNWLEVATQSKLSQNHQIGFSGGDEDTNYSISVGYRDIEGLLKESFLERFSTRFTIDDQVKEWFKVGGSLSYNSQKENLVDINDAVARQIVEDFPFLPPRYEDGTFAENRDYPFAEGTRSSLHRLKGTKYILNTQNLLGSAYSNIDLAEGLEMRTVLGVNVLIQENNEFRTSTLSNAGIGFASTSNRRNTFWSLENYLTYNNTFGDIHSFNGLLGVSWQETQNFSTNQGVQNFPTDYFTFNNLGAGSQDKFVNSSASRDALNSYFGRINYSLMDKYLLTVTGRFDGSSKFGENNKYSFFPSAALAWKISEEEFLKYSNTISRLKLRGSYGQTGNSAIPAYSSLSLLSSNYSAIWNEQQEGGTGILRLANPNLKWEKTAQSDVGVELGLFNNRITIEADYYYRLTTDMLLDAPVPQTSGYSSIRKNVGSMENEGVEFSLSSINIQNTGTGFLWKTGFNISFNRNEILSLATPSDIFGVGGPNFTNPTNILRVGESAGSFWGLVRLGTWNTDEAEEAAKFVSYRNGLTILPGDIKYLDVNGDHAITDADRMIIGNGSPDAWGSFTNSFNYKNWDLMFDMQFSYGNDVLNMTLHPSEDRQALANSYTTVLNAWTPDNQDTPIAQIRDTRAGYVTNVDSHWVMDGSFIRGRNLLLGYTFPSEITERLKLNNFRIYASSQNFFLLTRKEMLGDPEQTPIRGGEGNNVFSQGMMWHGYPKPTTFVVGLQIGI